MSRPDNEPLPTQTNDDTDLGWGESPETDEDDVRRFIEDRPPHHLDRD